MFAWKTTSSSWTLECRFFRRKFFLSVICDPSFSNFILVRNFDLENVTFVCYWFAAGIFFMQHWVDSRNEECSHIFYTCICSHKVKTSKQVRDVFVNNWAVFSIYSIPSACFIIARSFCHFCTKHISVFLKLFK